MKVDHVGNFLDKKERSHKRISGENLPCWKSVAQEEHGSKSYEAQIQKGSQKKNKNKESLDPKEL